MRSYYRLMLGRQSKHGDEIERFLKGVPDDTVEDAAAFALEKHLYEVSFKLVRAWGQ